MSERKKDAILASFFAFLTTAGLSFRDLAAALFRPFFEHVGGDGFWTLNCVAQSAIPNDIGHTAQCATHAEQDGVEVKFAYAVVPLNHAGL